MTTSSSSSDTHDYFVVEGNCAHGKLEAIDCLRMTADQGRQLHKLLRALVEYVPKRFSIIMWSKEGCVAEDSMWRLCKREEGGCGVLLPVDEENALSTKWSTLKRTHPIIIWEKQLRDIVYLCRPIKSLSGLFRELFFTIDDVTDEGCVQQEITNMFVEIYREYAVRLPAVMYPIFRQPEWEKYVDLDSYDFSTSAK